MKTLITLLIIVQAQGRPAILTTPEQRTWLDKFGCHITMNTKNNDLADEAINLLNWRSAIIDTVALAKKKSDLAKSEN